MHRKRLVSLVKSRGTLWFSTRKRVLELSDEVRTGLSECKPVVALESTIITHGMPFPQNVECALEVEALVRAQNAIPATIALLNGIVKVGLSRNEIERLGDTKRSKPVKTSRRDFSYVLSKGLNGGTTVSATVIVCKEVGISVFATGGIGGVHRGASETFDISADLTELGRSRVAIVSSGVKSILDIPKTLEYLETQGVFVATIGPTTEFPAFYSRVSGHHTPYCITSYLEAAKVIKAHKDMDLQSGLLFAVPVPERYALNPESINEIIGEALAKADKAGIRGKEVTPFLLSEIATISSGNSLETNVALIKNNAKVAAEIAVCLSKIENAKTMVEHEVSSSNRPVIIGGCNLDCVAQLHTEEIKLDGRMHWSRFDYSAGGVGRNICEALAKLGCFTHFISAIGDDHQGQVLAKKIPEESSTYVCKLPGHNTAQCIVVLDKKGDCSFLMGDMSIHSQISTEMIEQYEELIKKAPLLIMDGNIPEKTMEKALQIAQKYNVPVFYEPTDITTAKRPFTTQSWKSIRFITPNLDELKQIATHLKIGSKSYGNKLEEATEIAQKLAQYIENVIVTLGPEGILIARKGEATNPFLNKQLANKEVCVRHYSVQERNDFVNVSGAGDCFASGFIAALLQGLPETRCISVGFAAALTALYSQSPVADKILDKFHRSWKTNAKFTTLR